MPGYDRKKSKFGSRKPRNTDKLSREEQKKITDRDKKRGLTKTQAQDVGLTGQKSRDAAVKLRANRATQKTAVAKEAKRKAAEKKKMKVVDNASLLAGGIGASVGQKTAQLAAQKAAKAARLKEINADILKIKDYPKRGKVRGMPQRALDTPAGKARQLKAYEEVRKRYLNKGGEIVKPAVGRIKNSKLERNILAGRPPLDEQDLKQVAERGKKRAKEVAERRKNRAKEVAEIRKNRAKEVAERRKNRAKGLKAGGLIKKKSIDGIAKRGKTRATRSK